MRRREMTKLRRTTFHSQCVIDRGGRAGGPARVNVGSASASAWEPATRMAAPPPCEVAGKDQTNKAREGHSLPSSKCWSG